MKNKTGHLTNGERHVLYAYIQESMSLRDVKKRMGRSISTWSDEISKNGGRELYNPVTAHFKASIRKWNANSNNPRKDKRVWKYVLKKLKEGLSPDQVSGKMRKDYPEDEKMRISMETIYVFINSHGGRDMKLERFLRRKKLRKKKRAYLKALNLKKQKIPNRISIHERPFIVAEKGRFGDWETDLMEGVRMSKAALSVQKERRSQYIFLKRVVNKTAKENLMAMTHHFSKLPQEILKTVTYDNGSENSLHETLNDQFNIDSYFCDSYASWQKGGVENAIGLVREYFPKGTNLNEVSDEQIQWVQDRLNNRPRKSLGYSTPREVLSKHLKSLGCSVSN